MTTATAAEHHVVLELSRIFRQARGDSPELAEVRRLTVAELDQLTGALAAAGVDVPGLLDQVDDELDAEEPQP